MIETIAENTSFRNTFATKTLNMMNQLLCKSNSNKNLKRWSEIPKRKKKKKNEELALMQNKTNVTDCSGQNERKI